MNPENENDLYYTHQIKRNNVPACLQNGLRFHQPRLLKGRPADNLRTETALLTFFFYCFVNNFVFRENKRFIEKAAFKSKSLYTKIYS